MKKRFLRRLRRLILYWLIRLTVVTFPFLPRWLGSHISGLIGSACFYLLGRARRITLANLKVVYGDKLPEARIKAMARRCFANFGKFAFDVIKVQDKGFDFLKRITTVIGKENLDRALSQRKGVIALTGHVGNWELLAAYFSMQGYTVNVVASPLRDPRLNRLVTNMRKQVGLRVVDRSKGLLEAVRCLRRGEILGVLIDQDTSVESVFVNFMGIPAKTAIGPVRLAKQTGAKIVPLAMLMGDDGNYRIEIKEPIELDGEDVSIEASVERCSKEIEDFIRRAPAQWVWMHKRWKSVLSDIYK